MNESTVQDEAPAAVPRRSRLRWIVLAIVVVIAALVGVIAYVIHEQDRELREAIEEYGYSSSQANHWRHELNEAYEYCRGSRADGEAAFDNGFRDGMSAGLNDLRQGKYYKPERHDSYEDGDRGYHGYYGDKNSYKIRYREGFLRGYQKGFAGEWR